MSLRAVKTLARTPPGHLQCIKQGDGVEKRLSASYLPLNLGDLGPVSGRVNLLDNVSSPLECLVDAGLGGSQMLNSIPSSSAVFVPSDQPNVSHPTLGDGFYDAGDSLSRMDMGLRDVSFPNSQPPRNCFLVENKSQSTEWDPLCQASNFLGNCGNLSPACRIGNSCVNGNFYASPNLDYPLESLGLSQSEKNSGGHFFDSQYDKTCLPVIQVDGMVHKVCKNAELGTSFSAGSMDPNNEEPY